VLWSDFFWSFEILQKVTSRNNLEAGTNKSYSNQVVVMLFVVVVHGGDGDKVENSLIPLNVSVILLNVNV
jgi:hypothetical protein